MCFLCEAVPRPPWHARVRAPCSAPREAAAPDPHCVRRPAAKPSAPRSLGRPGLRPSQRRLRQRQRQRQRGRRGRGNVRSRGASGPEDPPVGLVPYTRASGEPPGSAPPPPPTPGCQCSHGASSGRKGGNPVWGAGFVCRPWGPQAGLQDQTQVRAARRHEDRGEGSEVKSREEGARGPEQWPRRR